MVNGRRKPLIFISYSHLDREAKEFVQRHLNMLEQLGEIEVWEDSQIGLGDDWFQVIEAKLLTCSVAVLLISTDFLSSEFCMKEEVPVLLERRRREGMMIAPILLRPCAWQIVPWLNALQMQSETALLKLKEIEQEEQLAKVVVAVHGHLEAQVDFSDEAAPGDTPVVLVDTASESDTALSVGVLKVDITRLPTSGFDVVGRSDELQFLNEAFDGDSLNVVSLRAWGGVGKSTLVNKWCEYLAADNYRGAKRVFAWSFYSQGTNERVTSADAFIDEALRFFGDDDPTTGSPWSKGERLAELVGKEKALLILDGMEPLQDEHQGIKDPALARLVECLAETNAGLCVITTREPVKEFSDFPETTKEVDLEHLSKEAGRALLRVKGIRATDDLLEQASEAFGNHALALNLLASYLKSFADGDVSQALEIPDRPYIAVDDGKHPRRVMAALAEQFGEGPELDVLHIVGLFDRPADANCIATLRKVPALPGLTDRLSTLDETDWHGLLERLRGFGLLAGSSLHAADELDAHPLVRAHFGARLRDQQPEAWKSGHWRLYEYLKTMPEKKRPDSLAEMAPLFQAVHHGCLSGLDNKAFGEVYWPRLSRENKFYIINKLGAAGADLAVMANFFNEPFDKPSHLLAEHEQMFILAEAGFRLRALGRLREALIATRSALWLHEEKDLHGAASIALNLAELHIALGELKNARSVAEAALINIDHEREDSQRLRRLTILAEIQHSFGQLDEALKIFEEARLVAPKNESGRPKFYGWPGCRYHDFLLNIDQQKKVRILAQDAKNWARQHAQALLVIAWAHLAHGRADYALGSIESARDEVERAINQFRRAGQNLHVSRGLLVRAEFSRYQRHFSRARTDLDEVMRIATRCGMRLYKCDAHLEFARLDLVEGKPDAALPHFQAAEQLVAACCYHRRDPEIAELKEKLGL